MTVHIQNVTFNYPAPICERIMREGKDTTNVQHRSVDSDCPYCEQVVLDRMAIEVEPVSFNHLHPSNIVTVGTVEQWHEIVAALESPSEFKQARAEAAIRDGRRFGSNPSWYGFTGKQVG